MAKTIQEKMERPAAPTVQIIRKQLSANFPAGKMLIATPKVIEQKVKAIQKGRVITVSQLREELAKEYKADYTCPLTTGIFLRLVAENAEEQRMQGTKRIAPYWRVLQKNRTLNPKYPGGIKTQAKNLKIEGHKLKVAGQNFKVL